MLLSDAFYTLQNAIRYNVTILHSLEDMVEITRYPNSSNQKCISISNIINLLPIL